MDYELLPDNCSILLLDDHLVLMEGLVKLLHKPSGNYNIACCTTIASAQAQLQANKFQFLICDVLVPGGNTEEFILFCHKQFPAMIIVMLSSVIDADNIKKYFALGVNGYVTKGAAFAELKMALEKTYQGHLYVSSDLGVRIASGFFAKNETGLTDKETELLRLIGAAYTTNELAKALNISKHTVVAHKRNIMNKIKIHTTAGLVRYAHENKII